MMITEWDPPPPPMTSLVGRPAAKVNANNTSCIVNMSLG